MTNTVQAVSDLLVERAGPNPEKSGATSEPPFSPRGLLMISIVAGLAASSWIAASAMMSGRGLNITDESFYLLSYRWWHTDVRTFTGAQYIYGPIFQWLHYNIQDLRLVRLLTIVSTHLCFGWSFMSWLRTQQRRVPKTRLWELAGTLAIVASGGMAYTWLPASPGYNDVVLLGSLLSAAATLRLATHAARGTRIGPTVPLLMGPVIVLMLLAKWSSAVIVIALVGGVAVAILARLGAKTMLRCVAWTALGTIGTLLFFQFFVMPFGRLLPPMLEINHLVAARTNSPITLLTMYAQTTAQLLLRVALMDAPLILLVAASSFGASRRAIRLAAVASMTIIWTVLFETNGWQGGVTHVWVASTGLVAMALVAAVIAAMRGLHSRRNRLAAARGPLPGRPALIVVMLVLLPPVQGVGTGNPLFLCAVTCFAAWTALLVAVALSPDIGQTRFLAVGAAGAAILLAASSAVGGVAFHPYMTAGYGSSTASAAVIPSLASLDLSTSELSRLVYIRHRLAPYMRASGQPILAYDEMPGLVLALGGRPVGEAWLSSLDRERSADGVRAACVHGNPWGLHQPILLFNRNVSAIEIDALRSCHLLFARDYRELAMNPSSGIQAYVHKTKVLKR